MQSLINSTRPAVSRSLTSTISRCPPYTCSFHKHYNPSLEEQTCTLPDGRTIGFAEYGNQTGTPTFYFHGAPGCRYDGVGYHEFAQKLDVRIICPDRPGHGLSTLHPGRTLSEYPKDISDLAKHLDIQKYHVFGQSGGGPYAVACAYSSPTTELMNATVVAGMGAPECLTVKDAGLYTTVVLWMHVWMPRSMQKIMEWSYPASFLADDEKLQTSLNKLYKWLPKEDREVISDPKSQGLIRAVLREAFKQGPQGTLEDGRLYCGPWDFALADVKRKVGLIYGAKDSRTPPAFGRHYKQHLPDSELLELEDAGHITIKKYKGEILAKVVGKDPPPKEVEAVAENQLVS